MGGKQKKLTVSRRDFINRAGVGIAGTMFGRNGKPASAPDVGVKDSRTKPALNSPRLEGERYQATVPATLDLAERARLGIQHFMALTSEENDYEMYWGVQRWSYPEEVSKDLLHFPSPVYWGGSF